jgi:hypothetical protein
MKEICNAQHRHGCIDDCAVESPHKKGCYYSIYEDSNDPNKRFNRIYRFWYDCKREKYITCVPYVGK